MTVEKTSRLARSAGRFSTHGLDVAAAGLLGLGFAAFDFRGAVSVAVFSLAAPGGSILDELYGSVILSWPLHGLVLWLGLSRRARTEGHAPPLGPALMRATFGMALSLAILATIDGVGGSVSDGLRIEAAAAILDVGLASALYQGLLSWFARRVIA